MITLITCYFVLSGTGQTVTYELPAGHYDTAQVCATAELAAKGVTQ